MDNKKDIGKMFKEQLGDLKKSPDNLIWKDIELELDKTEDSKGFYWFRLTGAAALLITFTVIGIYTFNDSININKQQKTDLLTYQEQNENCDEVITNIENVTVTNINEIIDLKKEVKGKTIHNTNELKSNKTQEKNLNTPTEDRKIRHHLTNNADSKKNNKTAIINGNPPSAENKVSTAIDEDIKNKTRKIFENKASLNSKTLNQLKQVVISDSIEKTKDDTLLVTSINKKEETLEKPSKDTLIYLNPIKKKMFQRFNFAIHTIPTYSIPSDGSLISDRLANNSEKGKLTFNYGVVLTSDFNDRVSLRTGYNRIKLSTRTNNIKSDSLPNILLDSEILIPNTIIQNITNEETINLTQDLYYHEFSLELGYRVINKRFDWSLIGGASFLILQKDHVTIHSDSGDFRLGRSNNLKSTNTSVNFGSNIRYRLFNNIYFNIEPLLKYQLRNTSKNSENYKPFYFTIQTGLSIDF